MRCAARSPPRAPTSTWPRRPSRRCHTAIATCASSTRTGVRSSTCTSAGSTRPRKNWGLVGERHKAAPAPSGQSPDRYGARGAPSCLFQLPGVVADERYHAAAGLDAVHLDLGAADHEIRVGAGLVDADRFQVDLLGIRAVEVDRVEDG